MLFLQNVISAFEQLWANKLRSLLTVLGVIIGVMSTLVVIAAVQGYSAYVSNLLLGMGTNAMWVFPEYPPGYRDLAIRPELTLGDIEEVERSCPAIVRTAPFLVRETRIKLGHREAKAELHGTSADFQSIRNFFVTSGRFFGPVEVKGRHQVCVLGREVLRNLEVDEGVVGAHVIINHKRFEVIGVLEEKGSFLGRSSDNLMLIPYTVALDMYPEARRSVAFMAQAEAPEQVLEAKAQLTSALRRRHQLSPGQPNDFRITTQDEVLQEFNKVKMIAASVLIAVVAISLLVGGIGITNVMLVSVTERTREIGLRKALGARRRDILVQFLTEATVLSTVGGAIGVGIGYGITALAALHPSMVDVTIPYWAALLGVGFSMTVGVIFGLLPALKAAMLPPIDALRHE